MTAVEQAVQPLALEFRAQQAWALGILVVFLGLVFWGLRAVTGDRAVGARHGGLVVGKDGRLSTSKAIALMWTLAIGYCLLTIVLMALLVSTKVPVPHGHVPPDFIDNAFDNLSPQYLIAFGGPFASAVVSQAATRQKLDAGRLQKAQASRASVLDLVADDQGDLDLVDFQVGLFNLVAVLYVLTQFVQHPEQGIPALPDALTALTGISVVVYTGNKGLVSNPLKVFRLEPTSVPAGGVVEVLGTNVVVGTAAPDVAQPKARLTDPTGRRRPRELTFISARGRVRFRVPLGTPAGSWQVSVVSDGGAASDEDLELDVLPPRDDAARGTDRQRHGRLNGAQIGAGIDLEGL